MAKKYFDSMPVVDAKALNVSLGVPVNVKHYGAVGDGVTDDTQAFLDAIAAINTADGGTLILKKGDSYLISGQLLLSSNTFIEGNGATVVVNPLNWDGGITKYWSLFTTVNVASRPQKILYRIGDGNINYENIHIQDLTINLSRDGATLSEGNMSVSNFQAVRFEDSKNCSVSNCRFIDQQTTTINQGTQVVFFVRSQNCVIQNCYFEKCGAIFFPESYYCEASRNEIVSSTGTAIESAGGYNHKVSRNIVHNIIWDVSTIGINSERCFIEKNIIKESSLSGITLGHPDITSNFYNLSLGAGESVVSENIIESGRSDIEGSGTRGILLQFGKNIVIENNRIMSLQKGLYDEQKGGIVLGAGTTSDNFRNIIVKNNLVDGATSGFHSTKGDNITISDNHFNDVLSGVYYGNTNELPRINIIGNIISNSARMFYLLNGHINFSKNRCYDISSASSFTRGYLNFSFNYCENAFYLSCSIPKYVNIEGNYFFDSTPQDFSTRINNLDNAEAVTMDKITVKNNITNALSVCRLIDFVGQNDVDVDELSGSKSLTKTGTAIDLTNINGNVYNYTTPSSATTYTFTGIVLNGKARCYINAASEPTITGGTKITRGDAFAISTDMEMVVESPDGVAVEYYFLTR